MRAERRDLLRRRYKEYYARDKESRQAQVKARRLMLKKEVFQAYGGACSCCGVDEPEFLTLDHVAGDGAAHRQEVGVGRGGKRSGSHIYTWAKKNGFPSSLRCLCWNCNLSAFRGGGVCAHHKEQRPPESPSSGQRYRRRRRREALIAYGGVCACCGETEQEFLTLDHTDGKGAKHRETSKCGGGHTTALWARRHGYPPIFRTFCMNCNYSAHLGGTVCTHQRTRATRPCSPTG